MKQSIQIQGLMEQSGVKFGTSGARGLVKNMTDRICYAYTLAFIKHLEQIGQISKSSPIGIGGDLRDSTPRIKAAVAKAVLDSGYSTHNCGCLPSPALAFYGIENAIPTVMITGSHIPEDRNGIKYNKIGGEILKYDESAIRSQQVLIPEDLFDQDGMFLSETNVSSVNSMALDSYVARYLNFFKPGILSGMKIGVYQHSAVGRDLLVTIFESLGAQIVTLERADNFIPVDTEAVRAEDFELFHKWADQYHFDAIISTDGDSDRPLMGDADGLLIRGDVAGILCAKFLGADTIVTPISSNTAVEKSGFFRKVIRTRVGSPYVIEAMQAAVDAGDGIVCGYEANGGFLLATDIMLDNARLAALPTRDAVIVIGSILAMAKGSSCSVSELLGALPQRFTCSDRLKNFPESISQARVDAFLSEGTEEAIHMVESVFKDVFGEVDHVNDLDGCRIYFKSGDIVHLRPSGNAPEFRCYTESDTPEKASDILKATMRILKAWIE